MPYDIPESWEWVRLGNIILQNIGGGTPNKGNQEYWNGDIPWASVKDLNVEFLTETQDYITKYGLENSSTNIVPKDNIIIATRMGLRKVCNNKIDVAINQDLRGLIFLNEIVSSYFMKIYPILKFSSSGTTVKGISLESLNSHLIPLPPLAEQKRIVTQIERALEKVEVYAESYNKLQELDRAFPDKLKKSILQYAMQGKLVAQDPNDEPVEVLLEKIRAEKQKLYEEGKLKKKDLAEIVVEKGDDNSPYKEVPYSIPRSWKWVRLNDITSYIQRGKSPKYSTIPKYPVIAQKCNQWSGFSIELAKFVSPDTVDSYQEERLLKDGDLMWNSTGLGTLGRLAIYSEVKNPYGWAVADSHVTIIRLLLKFIDYHFIYHFLASPIVQNVIEEQASGSTKQKELATTTVKNYLIPLPPLTEQQRIVSKISQVFSVIESLV
ncbi:restriction endonuclease subunit S [Streptococcus suis]